MLPCGCLAGLNFSRAGAASWLSRGYACAVERAADSPDRTGIDAKPGGFSVASYERAIRAAGPSDFSQDFTRFAADVPEWRTGKGFRDYSSK